MTEPLVVDSSRLKAAGATLQTLVFPSAPPPIFAPGVDAVSAAINETLPVIESPVIKGLPAVESAVTRTGSSIVSAAGMYAETDQALGEHVGGARFLAAAQTPATGQPTGQLLRATADESKDKDGKAPEPEPKPQPDKKGQPADIAAPVAQLSGMGQALGPVTQGMQTIMSSVQQATGSMGGAGAAPAQLADDTTKNDQLADGQTQLVDEMKSEGDQSPGSGATPGDRGSGTAPVRPTTAHRPEPSEVGL
ncbi:hypothetical protein U8D42_22990 [Mycobacterium europaeum]|uniref:hypothetical protein n=1 Tax=Mycobacterium europaeum TaxID=761804 RepID=UPI002AE07027|nr:hypothetical protein [Mycobacterium europaeum]MEA1157777.1 hypothetical protein [Mycobacterium europaeum]